MQRHTDPLDYINSALTQFERVASISRRSLAPNTLVLSSDMRDRLDAMTGQFSGNTQRTSIRDAIYAGGTATLFDLAIVIDDTKTDYCVAEYRA